MIPLRDYRDPGLSYMPHIRLCCMLHKVRYRQIQSSDNYNLPENIHLLLLDAKV